MLTQVTKPRDLKALYVEIIVANGFCLLTMMVGMNLHNAMYLLFHATADIDLFYQKFP
jgi:hypothetical protein